MNIYNYLLFDAARAEINLHKAQELNNNCQSLYKGSAEEDLSGVAPYLFAIRNDTPFADWYFREGWNKSWGTLLFANLPFEECYKHFRKFLMVKTESGKQLYFRFYDPRVLRIFLPTCDNEQLKEFFGPIKMFIMEDEDPAFALQFWLENYELKSKRLPAREIFGDLAPKIKEKKKEVIEINPPKEENAKTGPLQEPVKRRRIFE